MKVGCWLMVVGNIALIPFFANAEGDITLQCSGTKERIVNHIGTTKNIDFYVKINKKKDQMEGHSNICTGITTYDVAYWCVEPSDKGLESLQIRVDRRNLKYEEVWESVAFGYFEIKANCEIAKEPKI